MPKADDDRERQQYVHRVDEDTQETALNSYLGSPARASIADT
jgi:hypothetical protein